MEIRKLVRDASLRMVILNRRRELRRLLRNGVVLSKTKRAFGRERKKIKSTETHFYDYSRDCYYGSRDVVGVRYSSSVT